MRPGPEEILIEGAVTAHRDRDPEGRVLPSPDWMDLSPGDRERLFEIQLATRILERREGASGLSTTARTILSLSRRLPQLPPVDPAP